jgi:ketosteroid isomerase-like protein
MKRILLVATFIFTLPTPVLCQAYPDNTAKVARALMKLEDKWARAVLRHDVKAMDRLLADEYIGVGSGSVVKDKAQTMADFRAATRRFSSIELGDFNLRADGDSYVVSGRARVKVKGEDHDLNEQFRYVKVYVRRRGQWQVIALHITRME